MNRYLLATLVFLLVLLFSSAAGAANSTWQTEPVDDSGHYIPSTRLVLDANGHPHIAYLDYDVWDVKYAYHDGATWNIETVHSPSLNGAYPALALDADGNPHIAWIHGTPSYSLMYSYRDGSTWHTENVDPGCWPGHISLAVDSSHFPHISYFCDAPDELRYAWYDGTWHIETLDGPGALGYTSIILDSQERPRIAYADFFKKTVEYASYNGSWDIETVYSDGQTNGYVSLDLDRSEHPHIAHYDYSRGIVWYFWYDGSSWNTDTVGSAVLGYNVSLKLDSLDRAHVSYTTGDGADFYVNYARREAGAWSVEVVAPGRSSWLALDKSLEPRISYCSRDSGGLWYASRYINSYYLPIITRGRKSP